MADKCEAPVPHRSLRAVMSHDPSSRQERSRQHRPASAARSLPDAARKRVRVRPFLRSMPPPAGPFCRMRLSPRSVYRDPFQLQNTRRSSVLFVLCCDAPLDLLYSGNCRTVSPAGVMGKRRYRPLPIGDPMILRKLFAALVILAASTSFGANAQGQAQPWPSRVVRIVVPYAAGGNSDVMARVVAQRLTEHFGQTFIVENRVGANGALAADTVAR